LNGPFVSLGFFQGVEGPEISSSARLRVDLSRIQTIHARLKFPDHKETLFI
jgi:hypothetical protein